MFRNRSYQRNTGIGVWLLAYHLLTLNDQVPPVTLFTVIAQLAIFLGFIPALDLSHLRSLCILPAQVWRRQEWSRLFFSSFIHADDMHLYYNMISFLWKGRRFERRFGSFYFAYLLAVFSILTNVVIVALSILADELLDLNYDFMHQCGVGFSGVIFALKVLSNHYFPHADTFIFGLFPVPSRFACWAELAIIQILVPNASFLGHLAGILVGLAYVSGPLKGIMDLFVQDEADHDYADAPRRQRHQPPRPQSRFYGSGTPSGGPRGAHSAGYTHYTGGLSEEEQYRRAYEESLRDEGHGARFEEPFRPQPSAPPFNYGY